MDINYQDIGQRIRQLRKQKHWSQTMLAESIGMTSTHISHIENATTKLSLSVLVDIANALGTTVDHLLCGSLKNVKYVHEDELFELIRECSAAETRYLFEIARAALSSLRRLEQTKKEQAEN